MMPSPDHPTSSTLPPQNSGLEPFPDTTHPRNGFSLSHSRTDIGNAINGSDSDHSNGALVNGNTSIFQSKQKAKAVLAASGIDMTSPQQPDSLHSLSNSSVQTRDDTTNSQPSRKRSRSGSRIPRQSVSNDTPATGRPTTYQLHLNQYVVRDQLHTAAGNDQDLARNQLWDNIKEEIEVYRSWRLEGARNPGMIYGSGYAGYGNGFNDGRLALIYPAQKKRPGNRKAKELRMPRKDCIMQAEQVEELVPIRLDLELEKLRLRDTFTWNLHDRVVTPERFAETLIEDFNIPQEFRMQVYTQICNMLHEQISEFHPHIFIPEEPLDMTLPYFAYKNDEMRIVIKLNITIGQFTLVDQFEWDMNNPINSPESFARQMAADMSLPGEFTTAIAHSIREQTQSFTRGLYISAHPFDGRPVEDSDIKDGLQPSPLLSVFRTFQLAKDYSPLLYELNETDLERTEHVLLREQRAQKRSVNRRGGPSMPDLKDRQRTVRTMIVSSVLPIAAESAENSGLFKVTRSASGRGRRSGRPDRGDDSEISDEDESDVDSPGPNTSTFMSLGTARTRGMRGAATAAQAAMRAGYGRSATPEVSLHHHETRTSARRFVGGGFDGKEDSAENSTSLIIKLRIPRDKLRRLDRELKNRQGSLRSSLGTPQTSTPLQLHMPPPTSTPTMQQNRSLPGQFHQNSGSQRPSNNESHTPQRLQSLERSMETPTPPVAGQQGPTPPLPSYVTDVLPAFKARYPDDSFEAFMRWVPDQRAYLPKFRCNDCPGKVYTLEPDRPTANFELHLKNRQHKEKVNARLETG